MCHRDSPGGLLGPDVIPAAETLTVNRESLGQFPPREETSELLRQSFFNFLEARRPNGTGGFSNCCSRQLHRMASDFSSSET